MSTHSSVVSSGGALNTVFMGVVAMSSLWYCYIRHADVAIRRREVRVNVVTTTLTLAAGLVGSYLSAQTRRDSIAHEMALREISAANKPVPSTFVRRRQTSSAFRTGERVGERVGVRVGERAGGRVGERAGGRVGGRVSGRASGRAGERAGERASGQVGERASERAIGRASCSSP